MDQRSMTDLRQRIETVLIEQQCIRCGHLHPGQACGGRPGTELAARTADAVLAALQPDIDAIVALVDEWTADGDDYVKGCADELRAAAAAWMDERQ